jgi:glycine cleavage system H protein
LSDIPNELSYTREHEWVLAVDGVATVGITDHAQEQLGDVVYVEMPDVGREVKALEEFASIDSVKAASAIYSPLSGKVVEINDSLNDAWELINADPYGNGWICKIRIADPGELDQLLTAEDYRDMLSDA